MEDELKEVAHGGASETPVLLLTGIGVTLAIVVGLIVGLVFTIRALA